jgi:light-regulated signal transduction histidine kinase (bacteriophytochrome)
VEIAVEPFAQEGQVYYAVSIRDRTEEVHRLNALVRSNRELERFAYIASHDLQAPARTIRAFVDLLREDLPADALTEDTRAYLDYLEQAATKMRAQISGLLELSRLKTDRSRYRQLDLRQVVDEALRQLEGKIEDSNATIIVDEHLGHAWGHESQLRLLFLNLIDNAIKYRDPDRAAVIEVLSESRGDSSGAKVVVRDNGIGIAAEQRERVFEVFHRLHTDAERQYPGSGIGLALCRRIVDQHDGQISIRETPDGTGTAVEILLPTEESARAAHLEIP